MSNVREVRALEECHDCGARPGQYHQLGCDVERCPRCGGQLLMCLMCTCPESEPDEPWPPPLDDRMAWTGEWPGKKECREFGWYAKRNPAGPGWVPCGPQEKGASPDVCRLPTESEWDRREKRYVRTTLTEALAEMGRRGVLWSRGWYLNRQESVAELTKWALASLERGEKALGYAYYTLPGEGRRRRGRDFDLHVGQVQHPDRGPVGLCAAEVGRVVTDCLRQHGVRHRWDGDPERPIRVVAASIRTLAGRPAGNLN
jgi:hypothetical protein